MKFDSISKALFHVQVLGLCLLVAAIYAAAKASIVLTAVGFGMQIGALVLFGAARRDRQSLYMEQESPDGKRIDYWDKDGRKWTGHLFLEPEDEGK